MEIINLVSVNCMAHFQGGEETGQYLSATLKFFHSILENCSSTDRLISDNMLKAHCMLYNQDQSWYILELLIRRLGVDMVLWQLMKIQKATNNAFPEIEEGAIFYSARVVFGSDFEYTVCPLLVLSNVTEFLRGGKEENMLKKVLPLLAVYVEKKSSTLTAEWYYIWNILETGLWHSKRDDQSASFVLSIISQACLSFESQAYKGNCRQLSVLIDQYRSLLPEKLIEMRLILI